MSFWSLVRFVCGPGHRLVVGAAGPLPLACVVDCQGKSPVEVGGIARLLTAVGDAVARGVATGCVVVAFFGAGVRSMQMPAWRFLVLIPVGVAAAVVVHEMGHFLCARMLGVPVRAMYLGAPPGIVFSVAAVRIHVGLLPRGQVTHDPTSPGRRSAILAAGPLANLATAGGALVLARPYAAAGALAWIWAGIGTANLVPFRTTARQWSDGANLIRAATRRQAAVDVQQLISAVDLGQRPGAVGGLLAGVRLGAPEAVHRAGVLAAQLSGAGRLKDLLAVHDMVPTPSGTPTDAQIQVVHVIEYMVLTIPGLPREVADTAAQRVEWVCAHEHHPEHQVAARTTLALARLRQHRFNEVEPLCADALAGDLPPEQRATVLAAIVLARRAVGLYSEPMLAEARALAPEAALVAEAASSDPRPQ